MINIGLAQLAGREGTFGSVETGNHAAEVNAAAKGLSQQSETPCGVVEELLVAARKVV